jgi:hypothetical protein
MNSSARPWPRTGADASTVYRAWMVSREAAGQRPHSRDQGLATLDGTADMVDLGSARPADPCADGRLEIAMAMKFKGPASRALDDWYSTGNVTANLTEVQTLLGSNQSFNAIIQRLSHTRPQFVYPSGPDVMKRPEFESVTRNCYLQAINDALRHNPPVPIETTWQAGTGATSVQCDHDDRGRCIEVTITLPQPDIPAADEARFGLSDVHRF